MKKHWSLLALVLVLAVLLGSYVYIKNKPAKTGPEETAQEKEQILKLDKDQIVKMTLTSSKGELIIEKSGDNWVIPGVSSKLNQTTLGEIADSFSNLQAEKLIEENPKELSKYGLQTPAVTAKATLKSGEEKVVLLGDKTLTGSTYYLMPKDVQKVYTVWINHGEHFSYTLDNLRDTTLANEIDTSALTYLKIHAEGQRDIEIKTSDASTDTGQEYGLNIFTMVKPFKTPQSIDTEKLTEVTNVISAVTPKEFVEEEAKDLSKYGLDKPKMDLLATDKDNHSFHLQVGKDKDDSSAYFMLGDSKTVYTIAKDTLKPLYTDPFTMISKFAYIVNIDNVDKVEIKNKDKDYLITLTRTLTKKAEKEGEKDEYAVAYNINGKDIKEEDFKKYYQSLIGLTVDAENDKVIQPSPEVTTIFYLNKGDQKTTKVEYTPYNNDFYAVFRDNQSEFLISKDKVNKMFNDIENLLK